MYIQTIWMNSKFTSNWNTLKQIENLYFLTDPMQTNVLLMNQILKVIFHCVSLINLCNFVKIIIFVFQS